MKANAAFVGLALLGMASGCSGSAASGSTSASTSGGATTATAGTEGTTSGAGSSTDGSSASGGSGSGSTTTAASSSTGSSGASGSTGGDAELNVHAVPPVNEYWYCTYSTLIGSFVNDGGAGSFRVLVRGQPVGVGQTFQPVQTLGPYTIGAGATLQINETLNTGNTEYGFLVGYFQVPQSSGAAYADAGWFNITTNNYCN